jgi:hypothetical protein
MIIVFCPSTIPGARFHFSASAGEQAKTRGVKLPRDGTLLTARQKVSFVLGSLRPRASVVRAISSQLALSLSTAGAAELRAG